MEFFLGFWGIMVVFFLKLLFKYLIFMKKENCYIINCYYLYYYDLYYIIILIDLYELVVFFFV